MIDICSSAQQVCTELAVPGEFLIAAREILSLNGIGKIAQPVTSQISHQAMLAFAILPRSGYIMTTLRLITAILLFALYSCGQNTLNPKVTVLSNKILPLVNHLDNSDSCKQALLYLDSATTIDNDCFNCYYNKLMFQYSLNQFDKAIETMNECIRIKPLAHDLYTTGGILYEKIGDTISSRKYFQKSLAILNPVLDTMDVSNMEYAMLACNKAINLIMLDNYKTGNNLLKEIADRHPEHALKELALSFMNKSKRELVDMTTYSQYSR